MWKYLLVLLVLVALSQVEGGRGRPGRRDRRPVKRRSSVPAEATEVASWVRALPGNVEHKEAAFSHGDQVYVQSTPTRKSREFKPSLTIYDFSAQTPMAVLKVKRKCYLMETPSYQSREALVSQITPYNGTRREDNSSEQDLYMSALTEEQTQQLQGITALFEACDGRAPSKALVQPQPNMQGRTKAKVSGLDAILSLKKAKRAKGRRRNRNREDGERRRAGPRNRGQQQ